MNQHMIRLLLAAPAGDNNIKRTNINIKKQHCGTHHHDGQKGDICSRNATTSVQAVATVSMRQLGLEFK